MMTNYVKIQCKEEEGGHIDCREYASPKQARRGFYYHLRKILDMPPWDSCVCDFIALYEGGRLTKCHKF